MFITIQLRKMIVFVICAVLLLQGIMLIPKTVPTGAKDASQGICVPIIMYHSILKEADYGEKYIISEANLEADFRYLRDNGYEAVFMQDLIDFVYEGKNLCEKPVVLTFDDGCYNNLAYALPLLEKYDLRAVISIVGEYTDAASADGDKNPRYAYLDWEDCRSLLSNGRIELQNHSYSFHSVNGERKGSKKISWESEEHYRGIFKQDTGKMQEKMKSELGIVPTTYTYPFGLISDASCPLVTQLGFQASLSCEEGMNYLSKDAGELYMMKRFLRSNDKSVEEIFKNYEM